MKRHTRFFWIAGLLAGCFSPFAHAYYPLATDDTGTNGAGGWQVDTYAEWARDKGDGVTATAQGLAGTLTYGLTDTLDISLDAGYAWGDDGSEAAHGVTDSGLSLKWRFFETDGWSLALAPNLLLPTGDEEKGWGTGEVCFGLTGIAMAALGERWNIYGNVGWDHVNFRRSADREVNRQDVWHASAAIDVTPAKFWVLAAEVGIAGAPEKGSNDLPSYATVATVYSPSTQIDLSLGYRAALDNTEIDQQVLLGAAFRW